MMPIYSARSLSRLRTCDPRLIEVFEEVIKHFDCAILEGHRGEKEQTDHFLAGRSKVQFPNSKHNSTPSRAVDAAPYPINFKDRERFCVFAGLVMGIGLMKGVKIRWGGDWDQDTEVIDNGFDDLPHFEIVED